MMNILKKTLVVSMMVSLLSAGWAPAPALADACCSTRESCSVNCAEISNSQTESTIRHLHRETDRTIAHLKQQFINHRNWMTQTLFSGHVLPALMLFTEQMTATAMAQVVAIGMFLDAKHQLETQRLFQELTAQAHKDYHPSEGMCTFGTNVRSLAASDRNSDLTAMALSNRVLQRELLSGDAVAGGGPPSDMLSRINQFRKVYCDRADNAGALADLCLTTSDNQPRVNKDINYTATLDTPLTLEVDFTGADASKDEEDLFALGANLYAHDVAPPIAPLTLKDEQGVINEKGVFNYMNLRALAAKRSVASNSFAAIAAMKSQGAPEVQPYLYALMKEMGVSNPDEIKKYLGDRPSYYAQMEILTKKLYQNPTFYTELYDKPANVQRKMVSMQAIELMQRRDMYRSVLRAESVLSVMLETALLEQQEKVENEVKAMSDPGPLITLP